MKTSFAFERKVILLDLFGGSGGVGRCTREILRQLTAQSVPTALCGQSHVVDSFQDCERSMTGLRLVNLEKPRLSLKSLKIKIVSRGPSDSPRFAEVLFKETRRAMKDESADSPILVNYPQMIAPPEKRERFYVFLHDLNWRLYPGNFQDPKRIEQNCRGWVARAEKVITNSECTRDEVIERYGCDSGKVVAAPLAAFDEGSAENFDAAKFLAGLGLVAGKFFLFPGVFGLHKGHDTLTEALEMSCDTDPVVVTCGMPGVGINGCTEELAALRRFLAPRWEKLIKEKKLVVVGNVSGLEIQALRIACRAYVLPSEYEGFGFPLVEAIYHHRPAIVSDIAAHQEILKRYPEYTLATLFPPKSSGALAEELEQNSSKSIQTPDDWQIRIKTTWSWKHTVERLLSAFQLQTAF